MQWHAKRCFLTFQTSYTVACVLPIGAACGPNWPSTWSCPWHTTHHLTISEVAEPPHSRLLLLVIVAVAAATFSKTMFQNRCLAENLVDVKVMDNVISLWRSRELGAYCD